MQILSGTMHSAALRKRKSFRRSRWTLSRHLRPGRVPRRSASLLFALRRPHLRLSYRTLSFPEPSGRLRPTFHSRLANYTCSASTFFTCLLSFPISSGPCPYRYVLTIDSAGSLSCTPSQCPELPATVYGDGAIYGHSRQVQWVPTKNGVCYELGTSGPCSSYESQGQLLGYDVLKRQLECVDITNSTSPYFSSCEEKDLLDSVYDQFHPEYDVFRIWLAYQSLHLEEAVKYGKKKKNKKTIKGGGYERRQQGTLGAIQFPSSNIPLLNPTRTGTGQGKGTNPIV